MYKLNINFFQKLAIVAIVIVMEQFKLDTFDTSIILAGMLISLLLYFTIICFIIQKSDCSNHYDNGKEN